MSVETNYIVKGPWEKEPGRGNRGRARWRRREEALNRRYLIIHEDEEMASALKR